MKEHDVRGSWDGIGVAGEDMHADRGWQTTYIVGVLAGDPGQQTCCLILVLDGAADGVS